jgi:hypothetical protein
LCPLCSAGGVAPGVPTSLSLMPEQLTDTWRGDWNADVDAVVAAAQAALDAGPLNERLNLTVNVSWVGSNGTYTSLNEAQQRLRQSPAPKSIIISASASGVAHVMIIVDRILAAPDEPYVALTVVGDDWPSARRAFDAAQRILQERAIKPVSESEPVIPESAPTPVLGPAPGPQPAPKQHSPVRLWIESNQGLVAVIALVVTIIVAVILALAA